MFRNISNKPKLTCLQYYIKQQLHQTILISSINNRKFSHNNNNNILQYQTFNHSNQKLHSYNNSIKPFYITTPIFYVNGVPHIGHLYSTLLADTIGRYKRINANNNNNHNNTDNNNALCNSEGLSYNDNINVWYSVGTDEHGIKVESSATRLGYNNNYQLFCDEMSNKFKSLFNISHIYYNQYIRTSSHDHIVTVQGVWNRLLNKGDIYLGSHTGYYCKIEEAFIPNNQIIEEKVGNNIVKRSASTGNVLELISEENYKFKLTRYIPSIIKWLQSNKSAIQAESRYNEILNSLNSGELEDLSISRLSSKLNWAIDVPNDSNHKIYVWFDALINYLTVAKYNPNNNTFNTKLWPVDIQIIGKDILKFHAIIWPALLLALDIPLPSLILSHGHWLINDKKMSKSLGNVVNPYDIINNYGIDSVRYYLLRDSNILDDNNYIEQQLISRNDNELSDTLGNLLNRCLSGQLLSTKNTLPNINTILHLLNDKDIEIINEANSLVTIVHQKYNNFDFGSGIDTIYKMAIKANQYFDLEKPWTLVKTNNIHRSDLVIYICLEILRICFILLQPIIPSTANTVLDRLSVNYNERSINYCKVGRSGPITFPNTSAVLIRKINNHNKSKKNIKTKQAKSTE